MEGLEQHVKINSLWGDNLREFLYLMFQHDIVWKPKHSGDEPPF